MNEGDRTALSAVKSVFHAAREYLNPLLKESKFKETGVLTPEEFIAAGDYLVLKCPTWAWSAGDSSKRRDYFPADKQYLITRNVPCLSRVAQMQDQVAQQQEAEDNDEDGFYLTGGGGGSGAGQDIQDIDLATEKLKQASIAPTTTAVPSNTADEIPDMDDIPDLDDDDLKGFGTVEQAVDPASLAPAEAADNILRTRTYDLSITYDKYYQTPRMWLSGFDEQRRPLTAQQIFQDISQDHAQKTCTIEQHPHEQLTCASIHPCKHANVMKRLLDHMEESGEGKEMRVDQYLMIYRRLNALTALSPIMSFVHRDEERRGGVQQNGNKNEHDSSSSFQEDNDIDMAVSSSDVGEEDEEIEELPEAPHAPIHPSLLIDTSNANGVQESPDKQHPESPVKQHPESPSAGRQTVEGDEETSDSASMMMLHSGRTGSHVNTTVPASPSYSVGSNSNMATARVYEGCSQITNYTIEKKIGSGTFGEVSLAKDRRNGAKVALKMILIHNQKEGMPMTAMREIRILKRISHPNVIKLREMAIKRGTKGRERASTYMVFPYMEHDLDGLLQNPQVKFSIEQVKSYMQQLLKGIEHLHLNNILHRDIKSANILISNTGYLKVADFGLARPFNPSGGKYTNMVVTRWFRPPELLMGATNYDGAVDMWGVGCVFGEILKRRAILPGTSDMEQLNLIWQLCGTPNDDNWPEKTYLQYPMFAEGHIKDFDDTNKQTKSLGDKFPLQHFRKETFNLLDDLLQICPKLRFTATEALNAKYFKVPPYPAKPGSKDFSNFADSHELDSRNAKLSRLQSKGKLVLHHHHDVIRRQHAHPQSFVPSPQAHALREKRALEQDGGDRAENSRRIKSDYPSVGLDDGGL